MSNLFDDILDDFVIKKSDKPTARTKAQVSHDNMDDDWLTSTTDTKKSTANSNLKRQTEIVDDADPDDGWNRTAASSISYVPSFGGTGTLNSTNFTQGQDTIQRIINQPRPTTSSGSRKFDDLFGDSPPKSSTLGDTDKTKRTVRFEDPNPIRPSTAPPVADKMQNQSNTSVLSSLRTGLEPNKSTDMFSSTKTTTGTNKANNWLGFNNGSSDDDEYPTHTTKKSEPAVTTLVKRTAALSLHEAPPKVAEPSKKSVLDGLLEDDRRAAFSEKITPPIKVPAPKITPDFLFDDRTSSNVRSAAAGISKPQLFTDSQELKPSTQSSYDQKTGFDNIIFRDTSKDFIFTTDQQISTPARGNASTTNLELKKLEFENNELKMTVEHMKRQHEIEMSMLEEGYKNRLEYVEKSCERRESRLKEENEHLLRQLQDRTQQYENEKSTLLADHQRRLDDIQRDRTTELENLRTLQRQTLDHLRREHEQTIQRLKQLKQEEISTAFDVTTHTRAFESVVDHMEQNAKNIDELRLKIEAKHSSALTDKDIESRAKAQQLKAYEERLHLQANDSERERKNLQELISRLEVHLSEQTKLVEEERWKALQAQKRMEAMQDALNGEQRLYMEKLARDRSEIQRSKDQLLDDQKIALASIYESRSQLADERAKVEALQKSFQEQKHRDMLQNATIEAETRAQQKLVAEQLARVERREQELIKREEAFMLEKRSLNELRQHLDIEQVNIRSQQEDIKQKLIEIEHANEVIKKEKERLSQLYFELHALDGKNTGRLQQLQRSIQNLRQQEENMNEQYTRISNERENLKHIRSKSPFKKSSSVIDSGFSTLQLAATSPILPITSSQQSIEESVILRTLRMNALQDQLYIQDEMSFLNSIRAGNHLSSRSTSLSNIHRHSETNLLRTNQ
ncbi:unnamed protein product [Rotaria magnacalcarata]|uniref:Fas-binding factor 1 C-terminal domain-containing protein n=1 Tax=Rotaria magnacalcarata TaxID=392030 RepID=A0A819LMK7_9BILA|nr:unnamed protein product [Rotaria magnacalcarata]CAF2087988.1 unnamed protein product [Rotaria magnacalcarata]CAF3966329.1 unnamed protein product [Rotaria magnacalcarata]